MHWVLLDVAIGLLAVAVFVLVAFLLYRHLRALTRAVGAASTVVADASTGLEVRSSR